MYRILYALIFTLTSSLHGEFTSHLGAYPEFDHSGGKEDDHRAQPRNQSI